MEIRLFIERILTILKSAYRFRWVGLGVSLVLAFAGWGFISFLPDYYKANSKIYIDTQSLLQPLMRDISVNLDPDDRIQKLTKMILSRPNLEKIARMSDLDLEYSSRQEKEEFLKRLEYNIEFRQEGHSNLFLLGYLHPDPEVAKLVVQSILNLFRELTLSDARLDTVVAQKFLDEQIGNIETRLVKAEQNLAKFKRENMYQLPRQDQTYYEALQNLLVDLEKTKLEISIQESKKLSIEKQLRGDEPSLGLTSLGDSNSLNPKVRSLNELEERYNTFLQVYTEKHPDVTSLLARIQLLKAQIEEEQNGAGWIVSEEELNRSPVYQQMKMQLSEVTSEIASLEAKQVAIEKQAHLMEAKVDNVIDAETKLSDLNRDYRMNQQQYQALLSKREAARFAEDIDDTSENLKFRIVDPPYVISRPVWPNRSIYNFAVLLASLMGGFVAALGLGQLKPGYFDNRSFESSMGMPVLANIPFDRTKAYSIQARRQAALFVSGIMLLVSSFLIIYLLTRAGAI